MIVNYSRKCHTDDTFSSLPLDVLSLLLGFLTDAGVPIFSLSLVCKKLNASIHSSLDFYRAFVVRNCPRAKVEHESDQQTVKRVLRFGFWVFLLLLVFFFS
jgi:hypothetical protein